MGNSNHGSARLTIRQIRKENYQLSSYSTEYHKSITNRQILGKPLKQSVSSVDSFAAAIGQGFQNEILSESLGLLISYSNPISMLCAGLEILKLVIEAASAATKTYEQTQDGEEAAVSALEVVVKKAGEKIKEKIIGGLITTAINKSNINMDNTSKTIMVNSLTNAIEEVTS